MAPSVCGECINLLALLLWQFLLFRILGLLYAVYMLLSGASYIYTTRHGKFQVWAELLSNLHLHGNEHILDLVCGRGAVLLMGLPPFSKRVRPLAQTSGKPVINQAMLARQPSRTRNKKDSRAE